MTHENNPGLQQIKEMLSSGQMEHEKPANPEQAHADYWRLFYDIQAPLVETGCTDINSKAHTIAKSLYQKWVERKN